MKILKFLPGSLALAFGAAVMSAPTATADPYCYSFGTFSSCVEVPAYVTPVPQPPKPLPVWVCKTVFTTQLVSSVIPGPIPTFISRVMSVPAISCFWA
jgi:hypothetical protein